MTTIDPTPPVARPGRPARPDEAVAGRVLVVEDDTVAAMLIASIVGAMGPEVVTVSTGCEAIEAARTQVFDLVLLDVGLSHMDGSHMDGCDMDGYQVAAALRESFGPEALPIVFVSGEQDADARVQGFAVGGADFVTKPYDVNEVRARVRHQLETRRLRRELEEAAQVLEQRVVARTAELSARMTELRTEVDRRRELEGELRHLADTDPVTDLLNQRGLPTRLHAWRHAQPGHRCVTAVEVDAWESVVGVLGHRGSQDLLRVLADRIRAELPAVPAGRLGASMFVLGLERGLESGEQRGAVDDVSAVGHLRRVLEAPVRIGRRHMRLTFTIGAVDDLELEVGTDELLREAMLALHAAKQEPGSTVLLDAGGRVDVADSVVLEQDLWGAATRGELRLQYQPLFHARTLQVDGFEALVRWDHPGRGLVSPGRFIPIAERSGAIEEIGDWTLSEATRRLGAWHDGGVVPGDVSVAVNISAVQAVDLGLPDRVGEALGSAGLQASKLELELTETAVLRQVSLAGELLGRLRHIGVQISLDDFGTGSSSLTLLQRVPADVVKLDRSFVAAVAEDPDSRSIVESTVALAHRLGKRVVAEGIESEPQLRLLREMGCDHLQGFLLSEPLDAAEIPALVASA